MINRGIILAGGSGTRLYPLTRVMSKQLMPVYDKPLLYYPLSVLMLAGIRKILIITTPHDRSLFEGLLGDGSHLGIHISYAVQPSPDGLAQAFIIGKDFIAGQSCAMVLGDNIFYGQGLPAKLQAAVQQGEGATVFAYRVKDPEKYGVVEFDELGRPIHLDEKPALPCSPYAITGLYLYDNQVVELAAALQPSSRGQLEITDLNSLYLQQNALRVEILGRGYTWLDAGSHDSLLQAANYIKAIQDRQGLMVSCPEEIAYRMGYIGPEQLIKIAEPLLVNSYGQYLINLAEGDKT